MTSRLPVWAGIAAVAALAAIGGPVSTTLGAQAPTEPAPAAAAAPDRPPFPDWLAAFRVEAVTKGLKAETVEAALAGLEPLEVVVQRDRSQAEAVLSIETYVQRRLTRTFVRTARQRLVDRRALLSRVANRYHVQPRFIVAIWGLESNFGRFSGVRPIVQALATLAREGSCHAPSGGT